MRVLQRDELFGGRDSNTEEEINENDDDSHPNEDENMDEE